MGQGRPFVTVLCEDGAKRRKDLQQILRRESQGHARHRSNPPLDDHNLSSVYDIKRPACQHIFQHPWASIPTACTSDRDRDFSGQRIPDET